MRGMSADDIIKSMQEDSDARTERERRKTQTRNSLDLVTASIPTTKADLHNSIDDESVARTILKDTEQGTVESRARLAALEP